MATRRPHDPPPPDDGDDRSDNPSRSGPAFVDWADFESKLTSRDTQHAAAPDQAQARRKRRVISTVDGEVAPVRKNVQDAARTVVAWFASVVDHEGDTNLDDILDKCLRPSGDTEAVNYAALADEIGRTMNVELSAKRVQTAIRHLRECHRKQDQQKASSMEPKPQPIKQKLSHLHATLADNHAALTGAQGREHADLRRAVATEVLAAVRAAAGRLIENPFGEGIPHTVDIDLLEDRFLDFVRDVVTHHMPRAGERASSIESDLRRLLIALTDFDGSAETDMRLVVEGSRVVADLQSPESLPGIMAQLNVLVAGRYLLDSELYVAELMRLAEDAAALHDDADTKSYMNWVRRLPEDQRLPSPLRVSSYCLNNAATHILERVFRGEYASEDVSSMVEQARQAFEQMRTRDSGFTLVRTTQVMLLVIEARLADDSSATEAHFQSLGRDTSLAVLEDLAKYDNAADVVDAARLYAVKAIPELKHQLIDLR